MRFPAFPRTILWASILGFVVPLVMMALFWLHVFRIAGIWLIYIWPSSIMLMATEHGCMDYRFEAFSILAYSVGINIILYVVVFSILWSLAWVIRAWRLSLRDGTTI